MRKLYLLLIFSLFYSNFSTAQNKLDLRSPDKQKYFACGAVVGGASYAFFHSHYSRIATRENKSKIHLKALAASTLTSFTIGVLKQTYDLNTAQYNLIADDYSMDIASVLLGSLSVGISIPLFR